MKLIPTQGGHKHPGHLLAHGPVHKAWNIARGWYETNEYCISPSSSLYDKKYLLRNPA